MDIQARSPFKLTEKEWETIKSRYLSGESYRKIAIDYPVHHNTIRYGLKRIGIEIRSRYNPTEQEWEAVIERYISGESCRKIARDYPFGYMMIYNELKRRDITFRAKGKPLKYYEDYFENIDIGEKAYILGIFYADGCNHRNSISLNLHQNDKDLVKQIRDCIDTNLPIYEYERIVNNKRYPICVLSLCGVALSCRMSELGCIPKKSLVLRYPDWMPTDLHCHFIRGYFDGDGCISIKKRGRMKGYPHIALSGTMSFLTTTRNIIQAQLGIKGNVYRDDKLDMWGVCRLRYNGFSAVLSVGNWMYKDARIYMKRKHRIFREVVQREECRHEGKHQNEKQFRLWKGIS